MKLYFYPVAAIFAALICTQSFAQTNSFPPDGNVSIGAGTPTPGTYSINIVRNNADGGTTNGPSIFLKNSNPNDPSGSGYNIAWQNMWAGNGQVMGQIAVNYGTGGSAPWNTGSGLYICTHTNHPMLFFTGSPTTEKMRITSDGKVGIGTTSPLDKLHVNGNIRLTGGYETFFEDTGQIRSFDDYHRILFRRSENIMEFREYGNIIFSPGTTSSTSTSQVIMMSNGNVGIGTTNPQGKLAVKGDIYAMKVKVTQTGWGDYVFQTNYHLRPLSELEEYINEHHHLPEIPSAGEIEKNGLDLGDNQAKSVVKIEELTLYLIQQNKIIEQLNSKVADLEKELQALKKDK